jgi:hypothetical protein
VSKSARQLAILAVLAVVLAAILFLRRDTTGVIVATPGPAAARGTATAAAAQMPVVDLQLDRLKATRAPIAPAARNPFRFRAADARPAAIARGVTQPPPPPPTVPVGPPPPPPIQLKYIGLLDAPARIGRVAILSDTRGNVFYGKEGDVIEGRYQLLKINTDSAELAYADGRGRQTLRLSGQ